MSGNGEKISEISSGKNQPEMTPDMMRLQLAALRQQAEAVPGRPSALLTQAERSAAIKRAKETMGPDRMSEVAKKGKETMGPDRLSEASKKGQETRQFQKQFGNIIDLSGGQGGSSQQ